MLNFSRSKRCEIKDFSFRFWWKKTYFFNHFLCTLQARCVCFFLNFLRWKTYKIKDFSFRFWCQKNELFFDIWSLPICISGRKTYFSITFCVLYNLDVCILLNFLRKTYKIKDFSFRFWCQKKWALFLYFKISNPYLL